MFGIGVPELLLILSVALIAIGPKKLPGLAHSLGRAIGEFKRAASDLNASIGSPSELRDLKTKFSDMNPEEEDGDIKAEEPDDADFIAFQGDPPRPRKPYGESSATAPLSGEGADPKRKADPSPTS